MPNQNITPEQLACYQCGRVIKRGSECIQTSPSLLAIELSGDFPKAYHPRCFQRVEREAVRQLNAAV